MRVPSFLYGVPPARYPHCRFARHSGFRVPRIEKDELFCQLLFVSPSIRDKLSQSPQFDYTPSRDRLMHPVLADRFGLSREILDNTVLRVV
jgi:hypothetical protein